MKTYPQQFVQPQYERIEKGDFGAQYIVSNGGTPLTKRELFAAMAMQAMCTPTEIDGSVDGWNYPHLAKSAVKAADALIEALNATGEKEKQP